jgi:phage terminase large subunit
VTALEVAQRKVAEWRVNPIKMVMDEFGVEPDGFQAQGLREWADPSESRKRIAFQASAGPGKSAVLAWMGWNGLVCHVSEGNHPNGAAVSITRDNLKGALWKELAVWRERSEFLKAAFEMTSERIFAREHPLTWFLEARSFPKAADPTTLGATLSGLHSKYVFYLLDETGAMPPQIGRAAEQGLARCEWGRIAQAGNPLSETGLLGESVKLQSHLWVVIPVTGDPDDPNRSPRIPIEWAKQQIELYGRDNPWVMAYVLGKFPPTALNALLGPDEVREAMGRHLQPDDYNFVQKRIGGDIARFGDDATVLFYRQGLNASKRPVEMRGANSTQVAARYMLAKERTGSEMEFIDETGGHAAGVIDACQLAGVNLYPVNFSGKADDPRYFNKRSEMHFKFAEWVKAGGALPNMPELIREFTVPTYTFHNGKLRVVEKEFIKALLNGKSPDYLDAILTTFCIPDQPTQQLEGVSLPDALMPRHVSDWDVHRDA